MPVKIETVSADGSFALGDDLVMTIDGLGEGPYDDAVRYEQGRIAGLGHCGKEDSEATHIMNGVLAGGSGRRQAR